MRDRSTLQVVNVCSIITVMSGPELAWAGGFFDAEGSTVILAQRRTWLRLRVQVPQHELTGGYEVLYRFAEAVGGLGRISGPDRTGLYVYYTTNNQDAIAVLDRLLPWVSPVKFRQAEVAAARMTAYLASTKKAIGPRSRVRRATRDSLALIGAIQPRRLTSAEELAWAAGLFDGDGSAGYTADSSLWAKVTQSSEAGLAEVLLRIQRIIGCGRLVGPYDRGPGTLPQYEWICTVSDDLQSVNTALEPYLSAYKRAQWRAAWKNYEAARPSARPFRLQMRNATV